MLKHCRHEHKGAKIKVGVYLKTLSKYFEYLESRCLKSGEESAYRDLIELRLLFYAQSYTKRLDRITLQDIDIKKGSIWIEGKSCFPVPATFIQLAKSLFKKNEPLSQRDIKQLNQFVSQTASAAKIREKINPTLIRHSLNWICYTEQLFPDKLPRR